jgi:hypothetical protein
MEIAGPCVAARAAAAYVEVTVEVVVVPLTAFALHVLQPVGLGPGGPVSPCGPAGARRAVGAGPRVSWTMLLGRDILGCGSV